MIFFKDLLSGLKSFELCINLAIDSFRSNYHRTLLGPIWIIMTFFAFVSVKIFIFQELAKANFEYYVAYLTLGFSIWGYLSNSINGGATCFANAKNWILGIKLPFSIFVIQSSILCLLNFLFTLVAALTITVIFYPENLNFFTAMSSFAGLLFLSFSLFWVKYALAIFCVFFRDAIQLTGTIMRVAFFLTPIIWIASNLGPKSKFLLFNPFHHYLNLVRAPLIDGEIIWLSWYISIGITLGAMLTTFMLYQFFSRKIPSHI